MANTFTVDTVKQGNHQYLGMNDMILVKGTVSDIDAIADDVSVEIDLTIPNLALKDMVIGVSFDLSLADANASIDVAAYVAAADTLTLKLTNIDATTDSWDADTLNGAEYRIVIGKPGW